MSRGPVSGIEYPDWRELEPPPKPIVWVSPVERAIQLAQQLQMQQIQQAIDLVRAAAGMINVR
jgi:hypothetical protein